MGPTIRGSDKLRGENCKLYEITIDNKTSTLLDEFMGRNDPNGPFRDGNRFVVTGKKFQDAWKQADENLINWWEKARQSIDLNDDDEVLAFIGGPAYFPWQLLPTNVGYRPVIGQLKPITWAPNPLPKFTPNWNTATIWTHGDTNPSESFSDEDEFIGTKDFMQYAAFLRSRNSFSHWPVIEDSAEVSFVCSKPFKEDVGKGVTLWYHTGHGGLDFGLDFKSGSLSSGDISELLDKDGASIDLAWVMSCHSVEIFSQEGWATDEDGGFETSPLIENSRIGAILGIIGVGDDGPESFFTCCEIYRHLHLNKENIARAIYLTRRFLDPLGQAIAQFALLGDPNIKVPRGHIEDIRELMRLEEEE